MTFPTLFERLLFLRPPFITNGLLRFGLGFGLGFLLSLLLFLLLLRRPLGTVFEEGGHVLAVASLHPVLVDVDGVVVENLAQKSMGE